MNWRITDSICKDCKYFCHECDAICAEGEYYCSESCSCEDYDIRKRFYYGIIYGDGGDIKECKGFVKE